MPITDDRVVNKRSTRRAPPAYKPVDPDFVVVAPVGRNPQRFKFNRKTRDGGWLLIMELLEHGNWVPMRFRNELWLYGPPEGDE